MPEHREALRMLVARRRLFLRPIKSAPSLFTLNGIGTTAYGRDNVDPNDQTYILTQVVSIFFVPVFPLAQFLVRDAPTSGRRAWNFIARNSARPPRVFVEPRARPRRDG